MSDEKSKALSMAISQIEKSDGNNTVAISYAETALSVAPDSQDLIQYVNSLKGGSSTPSTTNNDKTGQQ